jgi:hypothetical protein
MKPFDQLAAAIAAANSPWDLEKDWPLLKAGIPDLSARLNALEKAAAAKAAE